MRHPRRRTVDPVRALADDQLGRDPVAHLGDVADHADDATAVAQGVEGVHHVVEGVGVERAEALVDEQRVERGAADLVHDHVGQAQRQRERHHERLAARQRRRVAALARPVVADQQAEAAAALAGAPASGVLEGVAAVAHRGQPRVGGVDDLGQPVAQDVGRQPHLQAVVGRLALDERRQPGDQVELGRAPGRQAATASVSRSCELGEPRRRGRSRGARRVRASLERRRAPAGERRRARRGRERSPAAAAAHVGVVEDGGHGRDPSGVVVDGRPERGHLARRCRTAASAAVSVGEAGLARRPARACWSASSSARRAASAAAGCRCSAREAPRRPRRGGRAARPGRRGRRRAPRRARRWHRRAVAGERGERRRRARPGARSARVRLRVAAAALASARPAGRRGRGGRRRLLGRGRTCACGRQPAVEQVGVVGAGGLLGDRGLGLEVAGLVGPGRRSSTSASAEPARSAFSAAASGASAAGSGQVGVVLGSADRAAAAADREPAGELGGHPVERACWRVSSSSLRAWRAGDGLR